MPFAAVVPTERFPEESNRATSVFPPVANSIIPEAVSDTRVRACALLVYKYTSPGLIAPYAVVDEE